MGSRKLTLILSLLVAFLLAGIGYSYYTYKTLPMTPDLMHQKREDAVSWATRKNYSGLVFEYKENDEWQKDIIIAQSIEPGKYLGEELVITLSSGPVEKKMVDIPKFTSKEEIEKWAEQNKVKLTYLTEQSDLPEGTLIKWNPDKQIQQGQTLAVYTAKPKEKEEEKPAEPDDKEYVEIEYDQYCRSSITSFTSEMKKNGLTVKETEPNYSFTIDKDTIFEHASGKFVKNEDQVWYSLSLGPYQLDEDDFLGTTRYDAESKVEWLNDRNAKIDLYFEENYSSKPKGTIYDCEHYASNGRNVLTCYISLGQKKEEPAPVTPVTPDPEPNPTPTPTPAPEPTPVILCNDPKATNYGSTTEECKYPAPQTAFIPAMNVFESMMKSTAEETQSALENGTFAPFTNVTYVKSKTRDYLVGAIYSVEVNGNAAYEPGQYEINTPITVYISQGY